MDSYNALRSLGLDRHEASVYLILAKGGALTASEVAALSGMHRPNTYDVLRRLESRALVSSFTLNGKMAYKARSVDGLKESIEEKLDVLSALSSEFAKYEEPRSECEVCVLSGQKALRAMQMDLIRTLKEEGGDSLVSGVDERKFFGLDELTMRRFFSLTKEYGFKEKVLVREHENYLPAPKETTTYRRLPAPYFDSAASFVVYGSKVSIVVFSEPLHIIMIRSRKVSDAYRKKFALLWRVAKPVRR